MKADNLESIIQNIIKKSTNGNFPEIKEESEINSSEYETEKTAKMETFVDEIKDEKKLNCQKQVGSVCSETKVQDQNPENGLNTILNKRIVKKSRTKNETRVSDLQTNKFLNISELKMNHQSQTKKNILRYSNSSIFKHFSQTNNRQMIPESQKKRDVLKLSNSSICKHFGQPNNQQATSESQTGGDALKYLNSNTCKLFAQPNNTKMIPESQINVTMKRVKTTAVQYKLISSKNIELHNQNQKIHFSKDQSKKTRRFSLNDHSVCQIQKNEKIMLNLFEKMVGLKDQMKSQNNEDENQSCTKRVPKLTLNLASSCRNLFLKRTYLRVVGVTSETLSDEKRFKKEQNVDEKINIFLNKSKWAKFGKSSSRIGKKITHEKEDDFG